MTHYDFSEYTLDHPLYSAMNRKALGFFKDKLNSVPMQQIVASVFRGKNFKRYLRIPILFFAFIIFSLRCFSKDRPFSRIRPKCFVP